MHPTPYGPIWKTITIGIHHHLVHEMKALHSGETDLNFIDPASQKKYSLEPDAFELIQNPTFSISEQPQTISLVVTTLQSLGLSDGCSYKDIFSAAKNAGLQLCPPEVGLQLRLQYMDQQYEETLVIGMQPIPDSYNLPSVFTVYHWDWGLGLGAACCGRSNFEDDWHADSDWVFMPAQ